MAGCPVSRREASRKRDPPVTLLCFERRGPGSHLPQPLDVSANIQSAQVEAPYQATTGLDYSGTASMAAPMVDRSAPGSTVADLNANYNYSGR